MNYSPAGVMDAGRSLPAGLRWVLAYQWLLVVLAAGLVVPYLLPTTGIADFLVSLLLGAPLVCWGAAMGFGSAGLAKRSLRGFRAVLICHGVLQMVGWPLSLFFVGVWVWAHGAGRDSTGIAIADMYVLFALMWLPFLGTSLGCFFYLRRLRSQLFFTSA